MDYTDELEEELLPVLLFSHYIEALTLEREHQLHVLAAGFVCYGAEEARRLRAERRSVTRLYLTRPQLISNPRGDTPWQCLFRTQDDRAFITVMGVNVNTFHEILSAGFESQWNALPIRRTDVSSSARARSYRRSLDAAGALGLVLHYLNSTMSEMGLVEIFALIPSTVERYIKFTLGILVCTLRSMWNARILWPSGEEFQEYSSIITEKHHLLDGAFGSMDGLNLPVQTSSDDLIENATYNGWLHEHFVSSVLVFSPRGDIIACRINAPGSWHDSRVARPIYEKLRDRTPDGYYLVTDTAFPRGTDQISGRIRAPPKQNERPPTNDPIERRNWEAFNRQLLSFRQTAEWGMRGIQGAFGRLRIPLPIVYSSHRASILEACVRMSNLRTRTVGHNQIQTVYEPLWREAGGEGLWKDFESMLFGEQQSCDWVRRFYNVSS